MESTMKDYVLDHADSLSRIGTATIVQDGLVLRNIATGSEAAYVFRSKSDETAIIRALKAIDCLVYVDKARRIK